jgi:hypothetical protein
LVPVRHVNSSATVERQQKEVLTKFEGMARGLKVGLAFDIMTDDFRRRLTVSLMAIADSVKVLLASLNSCAAEQRLAPAQATGSEVKARIIRRKSPEIIVRQALAKRSESLPKLPIRHYD